jgi:hypothetical protein
LGRFGQRPELSQATGIALVHCIPGKFLIVFNIILSPMTKPSKRSPSPRFHHHNHV